MCRERQMRQGRGAEHIYLVSVRAKVQTEVERSSADRPNGDMYRHGHVALSAQLKESIQRAVKQLCILGKAALVACRPTTSPPGRSANGCGHVLANALTAERSRCPRRRCWACGVGVLAPICSLFHRLSSASLLRPALDSTTRYLHE